MWRAAIAILMVVASGCSATMVSAPGRARAPSAYAPVNDSVQPGLVRYLNQGASSVVNTRREDAYKQMYTSCGGAYRIDAEGPQSDGAAVIPTATGAYIAPSQYWYIQFSCVPHTAAN